MGLAKAWPRQGTYSGKASISSMMTQWRLWSIGRGTGKPCSYKTCITSRQSVSTEYKSGIGSHTIAHLHESILLDGRKPAHIHPTRALALAEVVALRLDRPERHTSEPAAADVSQQSESEPPYKLAPKPTAGFS